jgi:hypothetical protein
MENVNGVIKMIKLFILTRLNTIINLIVARPTKSNAVINIISKLWVIRPIFGVMTYSLATLKQSMARLASVIIAFENFVSKLIVLIAIPVLPVSVFIHWITSTSSYYRQMFGVGFIRARFRTILPVLQSMFWSVESIVTELASFGVLGHQYNYILNRGLSK